MTRADVIKKGNSFIRGYDFTHFSPQSFESGLKAATAYKVWSSEQVYVEGNPGNSHWGISPTAGYYTNRDYERTVSLNVGDLPDGSLAASIVNALKEYHSIASHMPEYTRLKGALDASNTSTLRAFVRFLDRAGLKEDVFQQHKEKSSLDIAREATKTFLRGRESNSIKLRHLLFAQSLKGFNGLRDFFHQFSENIIDDFRASAITLLSKNTSSETEKAQKNVDTCLSVLDESAAAPIRDLLNSEKAAMGELFKAHGTLVKTASPSAAGVAREIATCRDKAVDSIMKLFSPGLTKRLEAA